jgi:AAA domain
MKNPSPYFYVAYGNTAFSSDIPGRHVISVDQFAEDLAAFRHVGALTLAQYLNADPRGKADKNTRWFSPAQYSCSVRKNANVRWLCGFVGDLDAGRHTLDDIARILKGYRYIAFSTYSHSEAAPKFRLVVPYSKAIAADDHARMFAYFQAIFGNALDTAASDPARLSYFPSCCADQQSAALFVYQREGVYFDTRGALALTPPPPALKSEAWTEAPVWPVYPDIAQAIDARKRESKLFAELMDGDHGALTARGGDWVKSSGELNGSQADTALVGELLQIHGGNTQATLEYMQSAGLALSRPKWDERYLRRTIEKKFAKLAPSMPSRVSFGSDPLPLDLVTGATVLPPPPPAHMPVVAVVESPYVLVAPIDWDVLTGTPPAKAWAITNWLGFEPTLVAGRGGAGKTRIVQALGTSLASGATYFEKPNGDPLNVLMWLCEDTVEDTWRQQFAINQHLHITKTHYTGRLHIVPRYGYENTLFDLQGTSPRFTPLFKLLREQVQDLKINMLALDNMAQVFGANEIDRHHVTMFVNGVGGLVNGRERPFMPVFLSHVARSQGSEYSGSAAWENSVRMRWYVGPTLPDAKPDADAVPEVDVAYVAKRKTNHAALDARRFTFKGGLFVPDAVAPISAGDMSNHRIKRERTADATLIDGFAKLAAMNIAASDSPQSPDYLPKQLVKKNLALGYTKAEMGAAMHRLMSDGRLKRATVKGLNRHERVVLAIA